MRRLMLLRHAKSSWKEQTADDHDRPLAARGMRDAPRIGRWMAQNAPRPDLVLCSTALRARQTCEGVLRELPSAPEPLWLEELYTFHDIRPLAAAVRARGGEASAILIVGHNNAIQELAIRLSAQGDPKALRRISRKYPTAALAILALDIPSWRAFTPAGARLEAFVRPRDLA